MQLLMINLLLVDCFYFVKKLKYAFSYRISINNSNYKIYQDDLKFQLSPQVQVVMQSLRTKN